MIYGIGVDLVEIARIANLYEKFGVAFTHKILTQKELEDFKINTTSAAQFIAKRFAAKEAFVKALGIGFRANIYPKDIGVSHDDFGKPVMHYSTEVNGILLNHRVTGIHLSIADEKKYSIAFVTLEK